MNRPLPAASVRLPFAAAMCIALAIAMAAHAVPVFYVSTQDAGAVPGLLALTGVPYSSTGTIHIWARSDVRLAGVSLDMIETGGAIKFTGLEVPNPNDRWAFVDGPPMVTNSAVTSIGGAAIPLIAGHGIGPGSLEGNDVLVASVNYMATGGSTSQLALRVGNNGIADYDGNFAQFHFGTQSAPILTGDQFGASGAVGSIQVNDPPPAPPLVVDVRLDDRVQGSMFNHTFTTSAGDLPITWGDLMISGPGAPVNAPSLSSNGGLTWNTSGSPLGLYNFDTTATNAAGSDIGRLTFNLVAPPPQPPIVLNYIMGAKPDDLVMYTFSATDSDTPLADLTWSNFVFEGDDVATQPTFDPLTRLFSWNTAGSPDGLYAARVTVSDPTGGSDTGTLFISLGVLPGGEPELPEPATMTHFGLAIFGLLGLARRR